MNRSRVAAADVAAMAALTILALAPLASAYDGMDFWIATAVGVGVGTTVAAVAARFRWPVLLVATVLVLAYFALGAAVAFRADAIAGVIPSLPVLVSLATGAVQVWKQSLTLEAPFAGSSALLLAPFIVGLLVSAVAVSLALRVRLWGFALLAPAAALVLAIAFSTFDAALPAVLGASFGTLALIWSVWRRRRARAMTLDADESVAPGEGRRPSTLTPVVAGSLVLAIAIGGGTVAMAAPLAPRDVLRDKIVPPLELHDYASPLTSFRKYVKDDEDETLLTVSGLPAGARIRIAALDLYDGIVYKVAGAGGAGSGVFARVGREIRTDAVGAPTTVAVTVGKLDGVWLPTTGQVTSLALTGGADQDRQDALHYNAATGTTVITTGLVEGDTYSFDAVVPAEPDAETLATAQLSTITTPAPQRVAEGLTSEVDAIVADAPTPIEQVRAIEAHFQTEGFFSHGLEGQVASLSGHGEAREASLVGSTQMVGDDEQYAVAMALMVAQLGIPVRVVMGFAGENEGLTGGDSQALTGKDLHAWVEVPFDGVGWVGFWPTPAEDKVPQEQTPQERQKPKAQVAQPPALPQEPAELPPAPPVEEAQGDEQAIDLAWLWATLRIVGIGLLAAAVLCGPSVALAVARARRRRHRELDGSGADRMDGGWAELVDTVRDVGAPVAIGATRREQGVALAEAYPGTDAATLSSRADAVVFGGGEPDPAAVDAYWADVRTALRGVQAAAPWHRRLRARVLPASVLAAVRSRLVRRNRS